MLGSGGGGISNDMSNQQINKNSDQGVKESQNDLDDEIPF